MFRGLSVAVAALVMFSDAPRWVFVASPTQERLRGVSAIDEAVVWASGSKGTVVRTTDGGATWQVASGPWDQSLDFRDVEAVDANTVYVLSIGSGAQARIYKTTDGGKTWKNVFTNSDSAAFYDAIAFWDASTGLALSDPVNGRFKILRTVDGGSTWTAVDSEGLPPALAREGAFAASGTCLVAARVPLV